MRAIKDPCNGPAIDCPIGHTLELDSKEPSDKPAQVNEVQDAIDVALKLLDKTNREIMSEAI